MVSDWHRWYDPAVGRWISEDPIEFTGGDTNLNRYVGNSPTSMVDTLGLASEKQVWVPTHYGIRYKWINVTETKTVIEMQWVPGPCGKYEWYRPVLVTKHVTVPKKINQSPGWIFGHWEDADNDGDNDSGDAPEAYFSVGDSTADGLQIEADAGKTCNGTKANHQK